MDTVIRFDQVTKRFGSQAALDRVSLSVPPGVVFALLGENGAGKTTAIRIMLGLVEPDAGKSTVLGRDSLREGLEIRRRVGYVPERPTLYEWMTVLEIGWFTAGFYGERFLPRYRELVAQFDLPERRKLKNLSKGMRAKVALSLAMAHDPELLVLDEPTSGLDTLVRREFLESMVDLAAAGRTVLLSSHQIGEVERVADIVAIIKEGKLLLVERLDDLKDQIRQLTITIDDGATGLPPITGEIIRQRQKARQWQILVRGLPLTAWQFLSGKLAFAVISMVLLMAALRCTGDLLMNGRVVDGETETRLWGALGPAAIEGLAWGMFFSLLLRRPLQAAVLAIAAASLGIEFVVRSVMPWRQWENLAPYVNAFPYRTAIAAAVLLIDVMLVRKWLGTRTTAREGPIRWPRRAADEAALVAQASRLPATRAAVIGRLAWQTWRQSRVMMLLLAVVGGLAALASPFPGAVDGYLFKDGNARIAVIAATAALMGSCVFLADQEGRRFCYFAEQAVPLRAVWLAKLLTWFAMLCAWAIVVHGIWFITQGGSEFLSAARELRLNGWDDSANRKFVVWYDHLPPIPLSLYLTIAGFACGQLGSMFLRSGFLAAFVGLVSTLILFGWAMLIQFLEISRLWSLAPIPLVLLFATWLRTPDWILERNTWRGWVRIAATLLCPLAALVFAMAFYRIYQIPDVSPGISPVEYARSAKPSKASEETANMFVQAAYLLKDTRQKADGDHRALSREAADLAYLRENGDALTIALKAAARPECSFDDVDDTKFQDNARELARLLAISARQLESEGKLDDAWDRWLVTLRFESQLQDRPWSYPSLPRWAAESGQTRGRIASAIKQLERFDSKLRSPADRVKSWYLRARRAVIGGPDAIAASYIDISEASSVIPWSLLPWERSRALRLLNVCTASDLQLVESVRQAFGDGTPVTSILPFPAWNVGPERQEQQAWLRTTPLLWAFYKIGDEFWAWNWTSDETERRATRIVMAIEAWKVDHKGDLPEHLSQLDLETLPLDPYTGKSFYFVRKGIAPPANLLTVMGQSPHWRTGPKKPFIWSPGDRVHVGIPPNSQIDARVANGEALPDNPDDITILEGLRRWRYPEDEYDVWLSGRSFEIPSVASCAVFRQDLHDSIRCHVPRLKSVGPSSILHNLVNPV